MQLGNPPNNEHLARFGVNLLWGEDWWDKIYWGQTDTACPVMAWLDCAIEEQCNGRNAPPPEPLHPETSWWHRLLSKPNVNVLEIIQLIPKQSTASSGMSLIVNHGKIVANRYR